MSEHEAGNEGDELAAAIRALTTIIRYDFPHKKFDEEAPGNR